MVAGIIFMGLFFGMISGTIAYERGRSAVFWFFFGFLYPLDMCLIYRIDLRGIILKEIIYTLFINSKSTLR